MSPQDRNRLALEREIAAERAIREAGRLEVQCQRLRSRCFMLTCYLLAVLVAAVASGYHYQTAMEKLKKDYPKQTARLSP